MSANEAIETDRPSPGHDCEELCTALSCVCRPCACPTCLRRAQQARRVRMVPRPGRPTQLVLVDAEKPS